MVMKLHERPPIPRLLAFIVAFSCWAVGCAFGNAQSPVGERDRTKFTEPPGKETDAVQKLIDQTKAALGSGKSATAILTDPTFLAGHEWPRFRKLIRESAQASRTTIVTPKEPGESLVVTGRVVDSDGRPVKQAVIYVYQTSRNRFFGS
jgi:hypothetical protein